MMKIVIAILFLVFHANNIFGQVAEVQYCGLDNEPKINKFEAGYFNEVFLDKRDHFDFTEKMIAFYTGSSGTTRSNKSRYFTRLKNGNNEKKDIHSWQAGGTQLLILTNEEKELSGGYDVILVSWSKLPKKGKSRRKLVERLKEISFNTM